MGTLATGSVSVAKAMAITGAIPFTIIIILQMAGFVRLVREDRLVRRPDTVVHDTDDVSPESTTA